MLTPETARAWYPVGDSVHGFDHIQRVLNMALKIAAAEGADLEIVHAAALLHDADGSHAAGQSAARLSHHLASAAFARQILTQEGWPEARIQAVEHCIRAHRFRDDRESPQTLEAKTLFDADKLDALGAIGIVRVLGYAIQNGSPVYFPPSQQFLQNGETQPDEPHSAYHEYLFKLRHLPERMQTGTGRKIAAQRLTVIDSFFEQLQAELKGS